MIKLFTALLSALLCLSACSNALQPDVAINTQSLANAPTGYDPLSASEIDRILAVVTQADGVVSASALDEGVQEVLLVERHDAGKDAPITAPRQGDVYIYDYTDDTLIHTIVNVASGEIVTSERVQGVQLPLTEREEARALKLIEGDPALWETIATRYQTIQGEPLTSLAQLQVKVSLFRGDAMPDRVNAQAAQCGQRRCAQVLLFTVERTLLDLMPIVDLSQGRIVQVMGEE